MVSGEFAIKNVPEMGALCSTEIFDGNAALFLLIFFFLNGHALKPFVNGCKVISKFLSLRVG